MAGFFVGEKGMKMLGYGLFTANLMALKSAYLDEMACQGEPVLRVHPKPVELRF
jgi:hypothetical protein